MSDIQQTAINALRFLAVDAVEKAKSGHPGAPLGDAPIAYLLFHKFMRHNPKNSKWANRDRFVLSNGHASALLYGVLHLTGYDVTMDDLKSFRQWGSRTPGHPEYGDTDGVEVTTGPLGQGFAMAIGMAAAERHLAAVYNTPDFNVVDHYTYILCGDGDLMEGISHEAASLAGTLQLGQADRAVRRQPDLARWADGAFVYRERAGALRCVPLAHADRRRRQRPERDQRGDRGGEGDQGQAVVHRGAHDHRLRQPEGGHQQGARRGAGAGGHEERPRRIWAGRRTRASTCRRMPPSTGWRRWTTAPRKKQEWNNLFAKYEQAISGAGGAVQAHALRAEAGGWMGEVAAGV